MSESEKKESENTEAESRDTEKLEAAETGSGLALDRHRLKIIGASAVAILVAGALFLAPGDRLLGIGDSEAKVEYGHHGFGDEGPEGHDFEGMDEHGGPRSDEEGDEDGDFREMPGQAPEPQAPSGEQSYGQSGSAPPMETGQS